MKVSDGMEQWKVIEIDGEVFPNYEVSTEGRVRSLNYRRSGQIKVLTLNSINSGYLQVKLCKNGQERNFLVQRLVATAFIPNPDNKPTVNHINENKHDNRVENLEWATNSEQIHHGTWKERVSKRVRCVETGVIYDSITQAEQETGIPNQNIVACCKGKLKTCGGFHWEYEKE